MSDMEWRFVFSPVMGNAAMLMDASAGTIPEKQAYQHDCTGRPCLDTGASFEDLAPWEDISGELPGWPPLYPATADGVATPAHAAAELATLGFWANAEAGQYQWTGGEHPEGARGTEPFRFIGIDRDLAQDAMIDAVWHETALNDDAVTALYFRRAEVAGWVSYMRAAEGR